MATESTLVATHTFHSPINLDSSFARTRLAKRAKSIMELYYYRDGQGFIEWEVPALDIVEHIGLTFDIDAQGKRTLTDYDGVFEIPDQALDMLEAQGVDVSEMRTAMAD